MKCRSGLWLWIIVVIIAWINLYLLYSMRKPCPAEVTSESMAYYQKIREVVLEEFPMSAGTYNLSQHKTLHHVEGLELYLHSAYLDERFNRTTVRLFGIERKEALNQGFICNGKTAKDGQVQGNARKIQVDPKWPKGTRYLAVMFDCYFPPGSLLDQITLTSADGLYSFTIPVEDTALAPSRERRLLCVCVKPLTGSFKVTRLVEWFEMFRMSGLTDFILYSTDVLGPGKFVLDYYQSLGLATIVAFPYLTAVMQLVDSGSLTPSVRDGLLQQVYLVALNDCFYRYRAWYENILIIDMDEVLLPTRPNRTLNDVVRDLQRTYPYSAGWKFNTAWHFDELQWNFSSLPEFMYMHRHARATPPLEKQPKSVMTSSEAVTVNYHSVMHVQDAKYINQPVPWESTAYVHHFRGSCASKYWEKKMARERCTYLLSLYQDDPVLPRYQQELMPRMAKILDHLGV